MTLNTLLNLQLKVSVSRIFLLEPRISSFVFCLPQVQISGHGCYLHRMFYGICEPLLILIISLFSITWFFASLFWDSNQPIWSSHRFILDLAGFLYTLHNMRVVLVSVCRFCFFFTNCVCHFLIFLKTGNLFLSEKRDRLIGIMC